MVTKPIQVIIIMTGMITIYGAGANFAGRRKWQALGCYKNEVKHSTSQHFLGYAKGSIIRQLVRNCRRMADRRNFDYLLIRNRNECWGSNYHAFGGCARDCQSIAKRPRLGVGRNALSSFVYYKMEVKSLRKTCIPCAPCGVPKRQYRLVLRRDKGPNCPPYNRKVVQHSIIPCCGDIYSTFYGPWSACNQICGNGGTQTKNRDCSNLNKKDRKSCNKQPEQRVRSCKCRNCPKPCSFDGVLLQLLKDLTGVSQNNHMIEAFSQVYEAMNSGGIHPFISIPSDHFLLDKIKVSLLLNTYGKDKHARTLLGVLLDRKRGTSCDYANVVQQVKTEIGEDGFKRLINADGDVTLTFVIDIRKSMRSIIHKAISIAKTIAGYQTNVDYVLTTLTEDATDGTFIDSKFIGSTFKVQRFNDLKEFTTALKRLAVKQGGDGSESVYAGIIKAITQGNPKIGSPMYVFTDAPPKPFGDFTRESAIYHAQMNKMSVNFFLHDSSCALEANSDYEAIAKATGGFSLSSESSTCKYIEQLVKGTLNGTSFIASGVINASKSSILTRKVTQQENGFVIDDIAQDGTILVEVMGSYGNEIELINERGYPFPYYRYHEGTIIWIIHRPSVGQWTFRGHKNVQFKVKSLESKLGIEFTLVYMRNNNAIKHPLIGEKAKAKLTIPNISRLKGVLNIKDWKVLSTNNDGTLLIESEKTLKRDVKMVVRGKTFSGVNFTREELIQPKVAVIRSLMPAWQSVYKLKEKITYAVVIHFTKDMRGEKFQIQLKMRSNGNNWATKWENDVIVNGDYKISKTLTAPSKGELTVKIIVTKKNVEIDLMEETFDIE